MTHGKSPTDAGQCIGVRRPHERHAKRDDGAVRSDRQYVFHPGARASRRRRLPLERLAQGSLTYLDCHLPDDGDDTDRQQDLHRPEYARDLERPLGYGECSRRDKP